MNNQAAEFQDLLNALGKAWCGLPDKPGETPEGTLRALWSFVSGTSANGDLTPLPEAEAATLRTLVDRRISGEPLSYLIGRAPFMGIEFLSGPDAMIPRVETELLAQAALQLLREVSGAGGQTTVIDLCTGSGNVGLSLAFREPGCRLFGGDISDRAVRLAERNATFLGLADRATFLVGDFLEPFRNELLPGSVGLITCNPPYISTGSVKRLPVEISGFEPEQAFDGGPFGLSLLMRLVKEAHRFLLADGWVVCETGLGQGEMVVNMFKKSNNYRTVRSFQDSVGATRVVAAQK